MYKDIKPYKSERAITVNPSDDKYLEMLRQRRERKNIFTEL